MQILSMYYLALFAACSAEIGSKLNASVNLEIDVEYQTQLEQAKTELMKYVSAFSLDILGLSSSYLTRGCPETESGLLSCIERFVSVKHEQLVASYLEKANHLLPNNKDLKDFIYYHIIPMADLNIKLWINDCENISSPNDTYSNVFLGAYTESLFGDFCINDIPGKLEWHNWNDCSVTCGGGYQIRVASGCMPTGANCISLPVEQMACNTNRCMCVGHEIEVNGECYSIDRIIANQEKSTSYTDSDVPNGTLIPWIDLPHTNDRSPPLKPAKYGENWISCNGHDRCTKGDWAGESCTDLQDYFLAGSSTYRPMLRKYEAKINNHRHTSFVSEPSSYHECTQGIHHHDQCARKLYIDNLVFI